MKVLFPDTNVFLHFKPLADINWPDLCDSTEVRIMVCMGVFDELDNKKYEARLGDRAKAAIREIERALENDGQLRDGVRLDVYTEEPPPGPWGDRLIVQQVSEFCASHPDEEVAVVTGDSGMRIRCSAAGIGSVMLAEDHQLPATRDELQKKLARTQERLVRLEESLPDPRLLARVADGPGASEVTVALGLDEDPPDPEALVRAARRQHPKLTQKLVYTSYLMRGISKTRLEEYDAELDEYYARYEKYAPFVVEWHERMSRSFSLELVLYNQGSAVAKDVDVFVRVPEEIELAAIESEDSFDHDDPYREFRRPLSPTPPKEPKSAMEIMREPYGHIAEIRSMINPDLYSPLEPRNESAWLSEDGREIVLHVGRLKHGFDQPICTAWFRFLSLGSARPFELQYACQPENHPQRTVGRILVMVP